MPKPGIDELLVDSALDPRLLARVQTCPEDVFAEYDLTVEQREILRNPDSRMLGLFAEVLARQARGMQDGRRREESPAQPTVIEGRTLPDVAMAVTVVPCAQVEDGEVKRFSYGVWVNALPDGVDPESLPMPAGVALPGQPMKPLHVVLQLSAVQMADNSVGLWAYLRQATNVQILATSTEESPYVEEAAEAVRQASPGDRHDRILRLLRALR